MSVSTRRVFVPQTYWEAESRIAGETGLEGARIQTPRATLFRTQLGGTERARQPFWRRDENEIKMIPRPWRSRINSKGKRGGGQGSKT